MTDRIESGIILDERYSRAVFKAAIAEGIAVRRERTDADLILPPSVTRTHQSRDLDRALPYTLLHQHVSFYFDEHDSDAVSDTSMFGDDSSVLMPFSDGAPRDYLATDVGRRTALAFKPLILARIRNFLPQVRRPSADQYDALLDFAALLFAADHEWEPADPRLSNSTFDTVLGLIRDDPAIGQVLESLVNSDYTLWESLRPNVPRGDVRRTLAAVQLTGAIHSLVCDIWGLLDASHSSGAAAAASWRLPQVNQEGDVLRLLDLPSEADLRCFRVLLEEVDTFPRVETVQEALRLRDDKRIGPFREVLREWTMELRLGNANALKNIRSRVRVAMKELKRLEQVQRVAGIVAMLALPVAVGEKIAGMTAAGWVGAELLGDISFTATFSGAAAEVYARTVKRRHDWMLVGRAA